MSGFAHPKQPVAEVLGRDTITVEEARMREAQPPARSLASIFPNQRTYPVGFDAITVPAGLSAPTSGFCFLYGLRRFNIGSDIENDAVLISSFFEVWPTDWNGTGWTGGNASASAWGDARGAKARIVIAYNWKQMQPGAFTPVRTPYAGIDSGGYGVPPGTPESQHLCHMGFPAGSFGDTIPQKLYATRSIAPAGQRLLRGGTLDVGILFNGAQVAAASAGTPKVFHGCANIQLHIATLTQDLDLRV